MSLVGGVVIGGGGCQREGCVGDLDVGTTDTGKMGKIRRWKKREYGGWELGLNNQNNVQE